MNVKQLVIDSLFNDNTEEALKRVLNHEMPKTPFDTLVRVAYQVATVTPVNDFQIIRDVLDAVTDWPEETTIVGEYGICLMQPDKDTFQAHLGGYVIYHNNTVYIDDTVRIVYSGSETFNVYVNDVETNVFTVTNLTNPFKEAAEWICQQQQ